VTSAPDDMPPDPLDREHPSGVGQPPTLGAGEGAPPVHGHDVWLAEHAASERALREERFGPNPVIALIDAGHGATVPTDGPSKGKEVCGVCDRPWPCLPMVSARSAANVRGARMAAAGRTVAQPGLAQGLAGGSR
jgi:hypothetical protein